MATCDNLVGIKNVVLTFFDCDTNIKLGPISHKLSSDDLPEVRTCDEQHESLPGGFTKKQQDSAMIKIKLIRDLRVPLAFYQGCASVDISLEYLNGLVYTGLNGGVTGDNLSDSHQVEMDMTFITIDELLPAGALAAA